MVNNIQPLSVQAVYPARAAEINLNTCGDPDCGNYGLSPEFSLPGLKTRNAHQRRQAAAGLPALASGSGSYALVGNDKIGAISRPSNMPISL